MATAAVFEKNFFEFVWIIDRGFVVTVFEKGAEIFAAGMARAYARCACGEDAIEFGFGVWFYAFVDILHNFFDVSVSADMGTTGESNEGCHVKAVVKESSGGEFNALGIHFCFGVVVFVRGKSTDRAEVDMAVLVDELAELRCQGVGMTQSAAIGT